MSSPVRKAVIPAAGLGTRFLPATKALAKELLPLVDRPAIQYVVEEAVGVGIDDLLIVTGRGKEGVEDHFDRSFELEAHLEAAGKPDELKVVRAISEMARFHFVRQGEPRGLGHAVGVARQHVGGDSFAVLLPDDLPGPEVLTGLMEVHERQGASVIALVEVSPEQVSSYGCARIEEVEPGLLRIREIVEKPAPTRAPSNLIVAGRYVLTPAVFDCIERVPPGHGGEIQLTDALALLMTDEPVYGLLCRGERFDTGNKLGFLTATVELALRHPELGVPFRTALAEIARREGIG